MAAGSRVEGGGGAAQALPARVHSTIQSIKEIVKNHSDADIYAALKESNMDPNETIPKLLNQDPFREVKRKRDRRKEAAAQNASIDQRKYPENAGPGVKSMTQPDHTAQRGGYSTQPDHSAQGGGYSRNPVNNAGFHNAGYGRKPLPGIPNGAVSKTFRVVRDNRVNNNTNVEVKSASLQHLPSSSDHISPNAPERGSTGTSTNPRQGGRTYSQVSNLPSSSSQDHQTSRPNTSGGSGKEVLEESTKLSRGQVAKPASPQSRSTTFGSSNSVVGLYSSSTDPVHVPSPDSRAPSAVGAIKREVGVVGVRRQSSEDSLRRSSGPGVSSNQQLRREYPHSESFRSFSAISKTDQLSQPAGTQSLGSTMSGNKSALNNQYGGKSNQQSMGHQKGIREWKPKSSQKSGVVSPGVIGQPPKSAGSSDDNAKEIDSEAAKLQDRLSQVNIHETQNVIIAQHIRVPDTDRCQLTFGSFGAEYESSTGLGPGGVREELNGVPAPGLSVADPIALGDNSSVSKLVDSIDERVRNSRSDSPASSTASENQLSEKKESNSQSLDGYGDIGLVREDTRSYAPSESHQQQDPSELPSFTAYDPQAGYDLPYFRTSMDEAVRGQSLQSPQEALSSHAANSIPASTLPLEQQQQQQQQQHAQQFSQMYPQVHVSHFANLMPYRQFLSPVYVPPMAVPGYSSNPAYPPPHPSSGNSYMLMPGAATSHLNAGGLKYGIQQFKPVPGSPTGFGNFAGPAGYAVNTPGGLVGNATGMDDSSRMKYKDGNMYVSNPQAEASEIWIQNPREIPGLQSAPYYNMTGQSPHAYLPSHTGHASFNAAAAQSSHMQFPGLYHPPPQPTAMASPHHLGPAMGGNVGVGVAAAGPVAQVGAYQQPQLGQFNWTTNF